MRKYGIELALRGLHLDPIGVGTAEMKEIVRKTKGKGRERGPSPCATER
jgi:hypothetical protein